MENEKLYNLKLHEVMTTKESSVNNMLFTSVMRVPGGFIYRTMDKSHNMLSSSFVPFNNEFMIQDINGDPWMTNDLENKLNELEKLCENAMNPGPWDYKALCLVSKESMKLIKALKASVNQFQKIVKTDCTCGADDYPNEPVELCYGHEGLQEIQRIMCGGGDE